MANITCPLESLAFDLAVAIRSKVKRAESDGTVDEEERLDITILRSFQQRASRSAALKKLGRHIEQLNDVTEYTNRLAKVADLQIVDLETERAARSGNIVHFPTRHSAG